MQNTNRLKYLHSVTPIQKYKNRTKIEKNKTKTKKIGRKENKNIEK